MGYRERRLAKAARLREWAEKRDAKATSAFQRVDELASQIPLGQPILVGHHSERHARRDAERIHTGMQAGIENNRTANAFRSRADNIESAADRAICSDDANAIERLQERIAELEAQRDRIKAYNASCRKGTPDLSLLSPDQVNDLARALTYSPYACKGQQFPGYGLSNLTGNIARQRQRLAELQRR